MKRVDSPRVKILYDIYHAQIMDGDIVRNIRDHIRGSAISTRRKSGPQRNRRLAGTQLPFIAQSIAELDSPAMRPRVHARAGSRPDHQPSSKARQRLRRVSPTSRRAAAGIHWACELLDAETWASCCRRSRPPRGPKTRRQKDTRRFARLPLCRFAGDERRRETLRPVLDGETHTGYRVAVHLTDLPPGMASHAPHKHAHEEVVMLQSGQLDVTLGSAVTRVEAGSVRAARFQSVTLRRKSRTRPGHIL